VQHGAQRSDALQTRDRNEFGVRNGPGSAVHHSRFALALHRIRDTGCDTAKNKSAAAWAAADGIASMLVV